MNKQISFLLLVCSLFLLVKPDAAAQQIPVIPLPSSYQKNPGSFLLTSGTPIVVDDARTAGHAGFLRYELLKNLGMTLSVFEKTDKPAVRFSLKPDNQPPGSYKVSIGPKGILISAASEEGLFYGVNTLLQLARCAGLKDNALRIDAWQVSDKPKYEWRGLMFDESRHFFGKGKVKYLLDWMAFYKLNRFHWHLTDEPGWRLEIKKYPKLTLVGGVGNYTDPNAPAAYYTQEDIREIVAYAAERFITVIPEVDMPGHAAAANRAYPQFSGGGSEKYPDFTFNPGKKETYDYLSDILKETNVLFHSNMVHLGGDEVHFGNEKWNTDKDVQSLMKDLQITSLKAVEDYFIQRMADTLAALNSKTLLWDEVASSDLSPANTQIFWWRHDKPEQLALALSRKFPVVLTPRLPFYFDFVQDSTHRVGRRWVGAFNPLERVYGFSAAKFHTPEQAPLVKGVQAAIWTERISTPNKLDHMLFPRISALAEAAWTADDKKDYLQFTGRLKDHLMLYRKDRIYFYNPFDPMENPEPFVAGAKPD